MAKLDLLTHPPHAAHAPMPGSKPLATPTKTSESQTLDKTPTDKVKVKQPSHAAPTTGIASTASPSPINPPISAMTNASDRTKNST